MQYQSRFGKSGLPERNILSIAPFTPKREIILHLLIFSAYPFLVFAAVISTLSYPTTGLAPGAVVKVTVPFFLSTVKSVPSCFSVHSPSFVMMRAVTLSASSSVVVSWYTFAVPSERKLSFHFRPMRLSGSSVVPPPVGFRLIITVGMYAASSKLFTMNAFGFSSLFVSVSAVAFSSVSNSP